MMGNKSPDPVDHVRTTRKHAGQNVKNTAAMPALIMIGVAALCVALCLGLIAAGETVPGIIAGVVSVLLFAAGFSWLTRERRRVRRVEAQYLEEHPEADAQTPTS
jgi:multisubunit Na+/H+ antiporter MnhB subunit